MSEQLKLVESEFFRYKDQLVAIPGVVGISIGGAMNILFIEVYVMSRSMYNNVAAEIRKMHIAVPISLLGPTQAAGPGCAL